MYAFLLCCCNCAHHQCWFHWSYFGTFARLLVPLATAILRWSVACKNNKKERYNSNNHTTHNLFSNQLISFFATSFIHFQFLLALSPILTHKNTHTHIHKSIHTQKHSKACHAFLVAFHPIPSLLLLLFALFSFLVAFSFTFLLRFWWFSVW